MDAVIRVTWSDGSASRHVLCGLPYDDAAAHEKVLNQKLADYLDEDSDEGLPLGWRSVELLEPAA